LMSMTLPTGPSARRPRRGKKAELIQGGAADGEGVQA
jgi:hypothetical protein